MESQTGKGLSGEPNEIQLISPVYSLVPNTVTMLISWFS